MEPDRLATLHLGRLAEGLHVELAVQARAWVVGDEMERVAPGRCRTEPLGGLEPGRMPRAVRIAESFDGRREDLDLAARRAERSTLGVDAELLEQHEALVDIGHLEESGRPELLERRR